MRPLTEAHFPAVASIYQEGLDTGVATFEVTVPTWKEWNEKFLPVCRWVAEVNNTVAGWCAISAVSKRKVYSGVAESTLYIGASFRGKGYGKQLLMQLLQDAEAHGYWTLQAHIFPENKASLQLHLNCGYREVGRRKNIAQRHGKWHDNILLEYRNQIQ
ncbi:GNAT family N-acetyltransferase [Altibacter sp. HG106]|uniref:GNAT family N-acetyltransferase n=1 Tax=Altibacter sp. HG106 TaxID=3023937 RepID=UPI00234FC339|nr:GNAT family N-acetyltransferase [Altibacter sp. HG106]MDC7994795.1 GNAT family N-acetyltransferase [Altibacter sp. HG106]